MFRKPIFYVIIFLSAWCYMAGLSVYLYVYAAKTLKDGVFEGSAFKFPGQMLTRVTIENQKITDIKVVKQIALKKYTDMLEPLIKRIIQKQSTEVDGVTGATISSNALKKTVEDALKKASDPAS